MGDTTPVYLNFSELILYKLWIYSSLPDYRKASGMQKFSDFCNKIEPYIEGESGLVPYRTYQTWNVFCMPSQNGLKTSFPDPAIVPVHILTVILWVRGAFANLEKRETKKQFTPSKPMFHKQHYS